MLRTATRLARRPPVVSQSRPSSSAAAHDHHEHEQDDTVYPKEGFGAPIWRKTLVGAVGAVLFYEYLGAPADNEKPWIPVTDAVATASSVDVASIRAAKEDSLLKDRQLVRTATRPPMYRSRSNPDNHFNHVSPWGNAVGQTVEWTGVSKSPGIFSEGQLQALDKSK
ncbi:hypothetical protein B0H14DRAFT_2996801 [Mycena olivaceomarginata]|nr:hypothetical protein B0H14DRAFT_2996801 [Mycena olivaceomarginata]